MQQRDFGRICVFCGSSPGNDPRYLEAAARLARAFVRRRIDLVYGGGTVGLMGVVANTVHEGGGEVTGVIPRGLMEAESAFDSPGTLEVVGSMHERKALMSKLSDGFIVLPGGLGTLEEFFETLTWSQLGIQRKPIGVLDVGGYFDPLRDLLERGVTEGFIARTHTDLVVSADEPEELIDLMGNMALPSTTRWLDLRES